MTTTTKKIQIETFQKYAIWGISIALIGLAISYAYLVNQAVLNVVERESLEKSITELTTEISELEVEYISMTQKIDLDLAYNLGYREAEEKKFVSRKPMTDTVSLSNLE